MDIHKNLVSLEKSGIIKLVTTEPDIVYLFSHTLFHDAAYHSILKKDRKALHLQVGQLLETQYTGRLEELAPILGSHFLEGGDIERAIYYLRLAADQAFGRYANMEAAHLYAKTLNLVKQKTDWDTHQLVYLYLRCGRALELAGDYSQAQSTYLEMEADGRNKSDLHLLLAAQTARTIILSIPSQAANPVLGDQLGHEALQLARQLGDRSAEGKILWCLMLANVFQNRTKEAKEAGEESLKIAREVQNREQIAYTLNDLGSFVYSGLGMYKAALKSLQEAYPIWMELDDLPMLTDNLISTALTLYAGGNYEAALGKTREADGISVPLSLVWAQAYSSGVRGIILVETGRIADSFLEYEYGITRAEQAGFMAGQIIGRTYLSMVNYYLGTQVKSKPLGQDDVAFSMKHIPFWAPQALASVAYHHLTEGNLEETKRYLAEAEQIARIEENQWFSVLMPAVKCEYFLRCHLPDQLVIFIERMLPILEDGPARNMMAYAYYYLGAA
ncbi:MAG: tetratricopeptide repeat protein, partial [Chloroflexi bacterium]